MSDTVTCRVCGAELGRMGIGKHAGMHKRQFRETFGYVPDDYDEVVEKADEIGAEHVSPEDQQTLSEAAARDDENCAVDTANDHSGGHR
jgi:hypothetical protein